MDQGELELAQKRRPSQQQDIIQLIPNRGEISKDDGKALNTAQSIRSSRRTSADCKVV